MSQNNNESSLEEKQRQTAENILRQNVLNSYNDSPTHIKKASKNDQLTQIEWKKYHSAWQNYYQKYYNDYYSAAAKKYVENETKKIKQKAQDETNAKKNKTKQSTFNISSKIKHKIQSKASDVSQKRNKRKKFIPLILGGFTILLIIFLQYNRIIFAPIAAYISPGNKPSSELVAVDPSVDINVSNEPKLIIPKINVEVPVSFGITLDEVMPAMNRGVAHYRIKGASAFPGEIGNLVIAGHSAGDIYNSNKYKYIFSGLERLEIGDLIYINYNSKRYTYKMTKREVIEPTNVKALIYETDKPILSLFTCTPLGTSDYRLVITAEQIFPTPEKATAQSDITQESEIETMPANEPSFFEKIWNGLFGD